MRQNLYFERKKLSLNPGIMRLQQCLMLSVLFLMIVTIPFLKADGVLSEHGEKPKNLSDSQKTVNNDLNGGSEDGIDFVDYEFRGKPVDSYRKVDTNQYYESYEYGGGSYDYMGKPKDTKFPCYSCSYLHLPMFHQGSENCKDPFDPFDVPEVMCNESCALTQIWFNNWTSYTIYRGCLPNCKELTESDKIIKCCNTRLCNDFKSSCRPMDVFSCLFIFNIFVILLVQSYFL